MNDSQIIAATRAAIASVRNARYLATERGYHGAFYCALRTELERQGLLSQERILEMEYQKSRMRHGVIQRPDIIFHIPTEISQQPAARNNFAVWALKFRGSKSAAIEDFRNLDEMCERLCYPLAFFVNIASNKTHLEAYTGRYSDRSIHSLFQGPLVRCCSILVLRTAAWTRYYINSRMERLVHKQLRVGDFDSIAFPPIALLGHKVVR